MNSEEKAKEEMTKRQESVLEFSLQAVPSELRITGGREISFRRAVLTLSNTGLSVVAGLIPHATLAQEGGSVQDVTETLSQSISAASLQPGEIIRWDVYDLLLAAHPGVASKVHLWGYKAILNWWFDVTVWVEYRIAASDTVIHTSIMRWKLRWIMEKPALEEVDLSIEVVEG